MASVLFTGRGLEHWGESRKRGCARCGTKWCDHQVFRSRHHRAGARYLLLSDSIDHPQESFFLSRDFAPRRVVANHLSSVGRWSQAVDGLVTIETDPPL